MTCGTSANASMCRCRRGACCSLTNKHVQWPKCYVTHPPALRWQRFRKTSPARRHWYRKHNAVLSLGRVGQSGRIGGRSLTPKCKSRKVTGPLICSAQTTISLSALSRFSIRSTSVTTNCTAIPRIPASATVPSPFICVDDR
jgi:hypothetical protein